MPFAAGDGGPAASRVPKRWDCIRQLEDADSARLPTIAKVPRLVSAAPVVAKARTPSDPPTAPPPNRKFAVR